MDDLLQRGADHLGIEIDQVIASRQRGDDLIIVVRQGQKYIVPIADLATPKVEVEIEPLPKRGRRK